MINVVQIKKTKRTERELRGGNKTRKEEGARGRRRETKTANVTSIPFSPDVSTALQ
jgi:hypothetical protein